MYLQLLARKTFTVQAFLLEENYEFPASCHLVDDDEEYTYHEFFYGERHEIIRFDHEDDENYYGVECTLIIESLVFYIEVIPKELALIADLFVIQDRLYQKT